MAGQPAFVPFAVVAVAVAGFEPATIHDYPTRPLSHDGVADGHAVASLAAYNTGGRIAAVASPLVGYSVPAARWSDLGARSWAAFHAGAVS